MTAKRIAKSAINGTLGRFGLQIVHRGQTSDSVREFIPAQETIDAAKRAGLSLGDYIDNRNAQPGTTKRTIDEIAALAGWSGRLGAVCEIGAGTGRYAEQVLNLLHPDRYEVYEPAVDWQRYLRDRYPVVLQPCDGTTLSATSTASIDFVHAHKVFTYLSFFVTCGYLLEMLRVTGPGGVIAFDAFTDSCLDEEHVRLWLESGITYPTVVPRAWLLAFMAQRGAELLGHFLVPVSAGVTEVLAFRRD